MITSPRFSLGRTRLLLEQYIQSHHRMLLLWCVMILGLTIVGTLLLNWGNLRTWDEDSMGYIPPYDCFWNDLFGLYYTMYVAWASIAASLSFRELGTRQGKIATLTLPATACEKFLVRWLVYFVGLTVVFFISTVITELLRVVIFRYIFGVVEVVSPIWNSMFNNDYEAYYPIDLFLWLQLIGIGTWIQSLYMLGGVVWPKLSFVKSSAAMFGLVIVYFFTYLIFFNMAKTNGFHQVALVEQISALAWMVFFFCLAALNWWIASRRLKETFIYNNDL